MFEQISSDKKQKQQKKRPPVLGQTTNIVKSWQKSSAHTEIRPESQWSKHSHCLK